MTDPEVVRRLEDALLRIAQLERGFSAGGSLPGAAVYRSTDQSVSGSNAAAIDFDTTEWDTGGIVNGSFDIVIPSSGRWWIGTRLRVSSSAFANQGVVQISGSTSGVVLACLPFVNNDAQVEFNTIASLAAGETLTLTVFTNTNAITFKAGSAPIFNWLGVQYFGA